MPAQTAEDYGQQLSAKELPLANAEEMHDYTAEDHGQQSSAKELPAVKGEKKSPQPSATDRGHRAVNLEPQEDNILPQLLGNPKDNSTFPGKEDIRKVQFRETKERNQMFDANNTLLIETIRQGNKVMKEKIDSNSRTVRCLEKTMET